jgi:hypothetical protein
MLRPSGDQTGLLSSAASVVSRVGIPRETSQIQMWVVPRFRILAAKLFRSGENRKARHERRPAHQLLGPAYRFDRTRSELLRARLRPPGRPAARLWKQRRPHRPATEYALNLLGEGRPFPGRHQPFCIEG